MERYQWIDFILVMLFTCHRAYLKELFSIFLPETVLDF